VLIERERLWRDIGEQRLEVATLVRHDDHGAVVDFRTGSALAEQPRDLIPRHVRRPHKNRDVELVMVEDLLLQHLGVSLLQGASEGRVEVAAEVRIGRRADEMGPERHAIVADRPPRDVELVVPGVEVADIARLERPPVDDGTCA
jgi:hypothetical protein